MVGLSEKNVKFGLVVFILLRHIHLAYLAPTFSVVNTTQVAIDDKDIDFGANNGTDTEELTQRYLNWAKASLSNREMTATIAGPKGKSENISSTMMLNSSGGSVAVSQSNSDVTEAEVEAAIERQPSQMLKTEKDEVKDVEEVAERPGTEPQIFNTPLVANPYDGDSTSGLTLNFLDASSTVRANNGVEQVHSTNDIRGAVAESTTILPFTHSEFLHEENKSNPPTTTFMTPINEVKQITVEKINHLVDNFKTLNPYVIHDVSTTDTSETLTSTLHDDANENIIKLADVEKIDLKSMKKYQSQINSGTGMGHENGKKKLGNIVMGHDGVKVTKKKQLLEKNFKDEEGPMNNSRNLTREGSTGEVSFDVGKMISKKITGGHLGPLVFKERTYNEHGRQDNLIFDKKDEVTSLVENNLKLKDQFNSSRDLKLSVADKINSSGGMKMEESDKQQQMEDTTVVNIAENHNLTETKLNAEKIDVQESTNRTRVDLPNNNENKNTATVRPNHNTMLGGTDVLTPKEGLNSSENAEDKVEFSTEIKMETTTVSTNLNVGEKQKLKVVTRVTTARIPDISELRQNNSQQLYNLNVTAPASVTNNTEIEFLESNSTMVDTDESSTARILAKNLEIRPSYLGIFQPNDEMRAQGLPQDDFKATESFPEFSTPILTSDKSEMMTQESGTPSVSTTNAESMTKMNQEFTDNPQLDIIFINYGQHLQDTKTNVSGIEGFIQNNRTGQNEEKNIDSLADVLNDGKTFDGISSNLEKNRSMEGIQKAADDIVVSSININIDIQKKEKPPITTKNISATPESTKHSTHRFLSSTEGPIFSTMLDKMESTPENKFTGKELKASQIEIEINVSEGNRNVSKDLMQFSFRNSGDVQDFSSKPYNGTKFYMFESQRLQNGDMITLKPVDIGSKEAELTNDTDILVVEITDADNDTDGDVSKVDQKKVPNENVKFYIRGEQAPEFETIKYNNFLGYDNPSSKSISTSRESIGEDDDLFVPDLKLEPYEDLVPVTAGSGIKSKYDKESIDRDSDTIFYISNTEVKVVESIPTPNTNAGTDGDSKLPASGESFSTHHDHHRTSKLESQFFPAIYEEDVIIDFPRKNSPTEERADRYEEDIILSPFKSNFDPLKIIRNRNGMHRTTSIEDISRPNPSSDDNLSVSYVAESFIDAQESPGTTSTQSSSTNLNQVEYNNGERTNIPSSDVNEGQSASSDVIIQPAVIPEISIGVPVIGELPPQIELKEIDFIPDRDNNNNNNNNNNNKENNNSNKYDDTLQYGGDFISNVPGGIRVGSGGYNMESGYSFGDDRINGDVGSVGDDNDVTVTSQIVMHAVDNLQKDELVAELPSDKAGAFKDSSKRPGNVSTSDTLSNATAYSVLDSNEGDFNFTDVQTLFLASFATLVPLVLSVLLAFGLRYLWRKYHRDSGSGSGLIGDNSTDPLAVKSMTLSQDELKSTESGYTINRSNDTLESSTEIVTKHDGGCGGVVTVNCTAYTSKLNHSGANGSVTKMTLKNNHLIVETEERNDISRDARETKMHYTPSEKDGVFVVEVARGVDSAGIPESPHKDAEGRQTMCSLEIDTIEKSKANDINSTNHEEVQIHQPPPDGGSDNDILVEVDETELSQNGEPCGTLGNSNTGLSQSDLSTSSGDSNKGYVYGNQQLYMVEGDDCRLHSPKVKINSPGLTSNKCENGDCPGENANGKNPKADSGTKPIITAALLKQDTVIEISDKNAKNDNFVEQPKENGNPDQGASINEKLHQDEQHQLSNGESTPLDNGQSNEAENGFDSIISLPAPPSTEEIKQMNDVILMGNCQLDSLPPPPPPENQNQTGTVHNDINMSGHPGEGQQQQNGVAVVAATGSS